MSSNKNNIKLHIFFLLLIIIFLWLIYIFFNLHTFQFFQDIYQPSFRFYNYNNENLWLNRYIFIFSSLLFIIIYILILTYTVHLLFNIPLKFFSNLFYFLGSIFIFVMSISIFYFDYLGNYTSKVSSIDNLGFIKWFYFIPSLFFVSSSDIGVRVAFLFFFFCKYINTSMSY